MYALNVIGGVIKTTCMALMWSPVIKTTCMPLIWSVELLKLHVCSKCDRWSYWNYIYLFYYYYYYKSFIHIIIPTCMLSLFHIRDWWIITGGGGIMSRDRKHFQNFLFEGYNTFLAPSQWAKIILQPVYGHTTILVHILPHNSTHIFTHIHPFQGYHFFMAPCLDLNIVCGPLYQPATPAIILIAP